MPKNAELRWIDSENSVDVVYQIEEGDRWKVGHIYVEIDGGPPMSTGKAVSSQPVAMHGE